MKYSIALATLTLGMAVTACGGFTEIGQGGQGGGGASNQGGARSSGGSTSRGGVPSSGGASNTGGDQGTANATSTGGARQCETVKECAEVSATCEICPDGTSACPTVECREGQCITSYPTCAAQTCTTDAQCPRSQAPCQLCDDGTNACPWARCENGTCKGGIDRCPGTNPCAGKACGETCSICGRNQSCPPVLMYCDDQEQCQLNQPTCAKTVCRDDTDCPEVGLCPPCADGTCAELRCVNAACEFSCGSDGGSGGASGGGTCSGQSASCANGETCCAGLECCTGTPVPPGNEFCGKVCPKSDQNIKRDFLSVDPDRVLEQLSRLPIGTWSYRTESSSERHIGPMAQDFMAAFQVGSSDRTILQVDADGVAFAAIQALNARLERLEKRNRELEQELERQRRASER